MFFYTLRDDYLFKAAFFAKAEDETGPEMRTEFENLARAYLWSSSCSHKLPDFSTYRTL